MSGSITREVPTLEKKRARGPTRRCVGSTRHISISRMALRLGTEHLQRPQRTPSADSTLGVVRPHFGLLW